jgi:lactate 2-monooxygenase
VGRPWLYGGIVAGQAGIEQVIKYTMADLDCTLGLSGYKSLSEIQGIGEELLEKVDL